MKVKPSLAPLVCKGRVWRVFAAVAVPETLATEPPPPPATGFEFEEAAVAEEEEEEEEEEWVWDDSTGFLER